jgi:threonine/homoserine/homoserine lactone efflux protein
MDLHALTAFAGVTLSEALLPGPSLAMLVETRASGDRSNAIAFTVGATLANMAWVCVTIFFGGWLLQRAQTNPDGLRVLLNIGSAYLILLATRRIISAAITLISGGANDLPGTKAKRYSTHIRTGFLVHFLNPANPLYYVFTFAVVLRGQSVETAILFGAIPVVADLIVHVFVVLMPLLQLEAGLAALVKGIFRLLASLALLYLVAHAFSVDPKNTAQLAIPGVTALLMSLGCVAGAMSEAYHLVYLREGMDNKKLWRIVAVWTAWFSAIALVGGLYVLIDALDSSAFASHEPLKAHARVAFAVAAAVAMSLTFAKSVGELLDEKSGAAKGMAVTLPWAEQPLVAGLGALAFVLIVFGMLTLTGLRFV